MFEPKVHEYSTPFSGSAAAALDVARIALVSQGFEITAESGAELRAAGPGMQSNRQSPLLGATELRFRVTSSSIGAAAVLGGVATMKAFVTLFPPLLILSLGVVFVLCGMPMSWSFLLLVVPWIFISPHMASAIERKTIRALDGLVRSMALTGARQS